MRTSVATPAGCSPLAIALPIRSLSCPGRLAGDNPSSLVADMLGDVPGCSQAMCVITAIVIAVCCAAVTVILIAAKRPLIDFHSLVGICTVNPSGPDPPLRRDLVRSLGPGVVSSPAVLQAASRVVTLVCILALAATCTTFGCAVILTKLFASGTFSPLAVL